ncbi:PQQ-binding-like beta-propeller repeat protein [Actinoplanes sp. NPDC051859]|uniref:outer membrane protein assembly factor BamB family protein n=1 Tax=Actinoplanes sp. NPDC051859 TaxID=3363909 RepID=UPI0037A529EC
MSVIELGLVTDHPEEPTEQPRRPVRLADVRRVLVAVVVALCVLGLTGSARPESHGLRQLWSVPFQEGSHTLAMGPDLIYVLDSAQSVLTAFGARDGEVRWSSKELGRASWVGPVESGVLLMPGADTQAPMNDQGFRQFTTETVGVDAATGVVRWRLPGEFFPLGDGRVLLIDWNAEGNTVTTLTVVQLSDGKRLWSQQGEGLESWMSGGISPSTGTDRLVTVDKQGKAQTHDLADGRIVARGKVPWMGQGQREDSYSNLSVDGHTLYLETVVREEGTLAAYDTETMRRKWQIEGRSYGGYFGCGPVLCINGTDGVAGYDRETGELRWTSPGQISGMPMGGTTILVANDTSEGSRQALVDGRTGRRFADLGTGVMVWDFRPPGRARLLLNRAWEPPGRTSVSEVDETGQVFLRGTVPLVQDYSCSSSGDLLVCLSADARLMVTDVG